MTNYLDQLGTLSQHPDVPEWLISSPVSVPFSPVKKLQFIFDEGLPDAQVSPDAVDAVKNFMSLGESDRLGASLAVYRNYQEFVQATMRGELAVRRPEEIWSFVTPREICVGRRSRLDKRIYIQLFCECGWDPEHGLQLVFREGAELSRVSMQDGHLTYADAFGLSQDPDGEVIWR